jgi:hypothetical protein
MVITDLLSSSYNDSLGRSYAQDTGTNLYCNVLTFELILCLVLSTIELHLNPDEFIKCNSEVSNRNTNSCFIVLISTFILTSSLSTSRRIVLVEVDTAEELFLKLVVISPRSSDNAARNK